MKNERAQELAAIVLTGLKAYRSDGQVNLSMSVATELALQTEAANQILEARDALRQLVEMVEQ